MTRVVAVAALLAAFIASGVGALEIARYEDARSAWRAERDAMGTAHYDAARSDAAYARMEPRRTGAQRAAEVAAIALLLAASLAGHGRTHPGRDASPSASGPRLVGATILDAVLVAALLALAFTAAGAAPSLALAGALARLLPALALALPLALLARGATPGMRLAGLAAGAPSPARAALAIALLPIAALWIAIALVPLAAAFALRRTPRAVLLAPHLVLAGLAIARVER